MLKEVIWSEERSYRTGTDSEPFQFYMDGLCNSTKLDLLLGYFSSAAINVLSLGFATFIYNGGEVRMVVNNVLSEKDKEVIKQANDGNVESGILDISDIKELKRSLGEYGQHFFQCIAWLIANDKIQIKIIKPKKGNGIAHYKSGIFSDGTDTVAFNASCNFTAFGLLENLEELHSFLSWENSRSSKMITRQIRDFESIYSGNSDFVEYLSIDDVKVAILEEFGTTSLNELLVNEADLIKKKNEFLNLKVVRKTVERTLQRIENIIREPKFPYQEGPRDYQITAYKNWVENGKKGIFAMATGTGKTITSLNCLLNEYKQVGSYRAVILVPTIALVDQWKNECSKFNFRNIIVVSSKEKWSDNLAFFNTASNFIDTSFIVIVTYASLVKPKFLAHLDQLPTDTLLIADEAHNIGSPKILSLLPKIHLQKRIGLSATPSRKYDVEGNRGMSEFFNDEHPYIYSYTMKDALDIGWLSKYKYYPHVVTLTREELEEYSIISKKLLKYLNPSNGRYKECAEVEMLLLERKRILHKAKNKKEVFRNVLETEFNRRKNLKYSLIYVPEGLDDDYSTIDAHDESEDDMSLIDGYTRIVGDTDDSVYVAQYTSRTKNRKEVIAKFEAGQIHVLTSMKCLDEGVDIPRSELAIFCASTGNPRQFIQRRGRVLRKHQDKDFATIHDLVVVPSIKPNESNFNMERNILRSELERVVDFSVLSMNKMDTYEELRQILDDYDLNLYDFETEI